MSIPNPLGELRDLAAARPRVTLLAALVALASGPLGQELRMLYAEGPAKGLGPFAQCVVNASGSHYVDTEVQLRAQTNLIVRDGHPWILEGEPFVLPVGASFADALFGSMSMNDLGDLGFAARLAGPPRAADEGLFWNRSLLAQKGSPTMSTNVGGVAITPGTPYRGFDFTRINDLGQMLVIGSLDDTSFRGTEHFAAILTVDSQGAPMSEQFLALENYPLPGSGEVVSTVQTLEGMWDLNNRGDWIGYVALFGDFAVLKNGVVEASVGSQSPAHPGRNLIAFFGLDLNDQGDFVANVALDGNNRDNQAIVRNLDEVVVTEGDTFPAISPHFITRFDGSPLRLANDGTVFWYATTSNPDPALDRCYFRSTRDRAGTWNHEVIVQSGVTMIGDRTVLDLRTTALAFDASSGGRYWLGQVLFANGEAVLGIDFGPAAPDSVSARLPRADR